MTTDQTRLKRGDYVRVRLRDQDEWTKAFVALASDANPSSVILIFDGFVRSSSFGVITGALPLTIDYEAETATSLFGDAYQIEVQP